MKRQSKDYRQRKESTIRQKENDIYKINETLPKLRSNYGLRDLIANISKLQDLNSRELVGDKDI